MSKAYLTPDVEAALKPFQGRPENASMLIDKYPFSTYSIDGQKNDEAKRKSLERLVSSLQQNDITQIAARHRRELINLINDSYGLKEKRIEKFEARLKSRLAINLADGILENAGINLDRTKGIPLIPGSAVKGCALNAAWWEIKCMENGADREKLLGYFLRAFGYVSSEIDKDGSLTNVFPEINSVIKEFGLPEKELKGSICFLPSITVGKYNFGIEINNAHYSIYYNTQNLEDLKKEECNPNTIFPVVDKGAVFSFCMTLLPNRNGAEELLEYATHALKVALTDRGIGAKTNSGLGWFEIITKKLHTSKEISDYSEKDFPNRIMKPAGNPGSFNLLRREIEILSKPQNRKWLEKFLKDTSQGRIYKKLRQKPWYQELLKEL